MLNLLRIFIALTVLVSARPLFAQQKLVANLSLFYFDQTAVRNIDVNNTNQSQKSQTNYTFFGLGLCYAWDSFCLGLKYIQDDIQTKTSFPGNQSEVLTRIKGLGLSLGYTSDSLVAHAVYIVSGSKTVDPDDLRKYDGTGEGSVVFPVKTGYLIDIGYGFQVASVRIGPLLSIVNMSYVKAKYPGTTYSLPTKEKDEFIVPQVALWLDI